MKEAKEKQTPDKYIKTEEFKSIIHSPKVHTWLEHGYCLCMSVFAPTNKTLQYCFVGELSQVQDLIIQREAKERKEQRTSLALYAMLCLCSLPRVFPMSTFQ